MHSTVTTPYDKSKNSVPGRDNIPGCRISYGCREARDADVT